MRQEKRKVTESIFKDAKATVWSKGIMIEWEYHVVNDELGVYLPTKLTD